MSELICIACPKGCHLTAELVASKWEVTGNECPRGITYGIKEMTNPTRVVTSTVKVKDPLIRRLPVVTSGPIPKGMMGEMMTVINQIEVVPPIAVGAVIMANPLGLKIDLISSKTI